MRRLSAVLVSLLICGSAIANDPPAKPIKQASAKEDAPDKEDSKSSSKEAKETKSSKSSKDKEAKSAEAARAKEAMAADELAVKIAERLSVLRKEKDDAAKTAARPVVRSYAPPVRRPDQALIKPKTTAEGHAANAAALAAVSAHSAIHWSYEGEGGPLSWVKLNPSYASCDNGQRQSPIDIRDGIHVDLDPLTFDYKASRFSVIDNGHTIQVNMGAGNYINVSGKNYELLQFHFHKPSEERVNGKSFEMVVHLVHKGGDGKLAVVAVLIERGKAQALVQSVWNNLPLEKNESVQALSTMDLNQLLPTKREYYTYMGSLTTPPCSEGVLWLVMKENIEISPEQLAIFNRLYPMNARPIQKTAGRLIKESN
ncbi:MAG: carbonic anhydrase family protein [Burkholderiales bacterium]|nr:carbonic anhydrase family protein [Burkholderiales bacterium]